MENIIKIVAKSGTGKVGMGMGPTVVYGISAPLESVQWPSPVGFSTSGTTSGKVPRGPKNLLKNSSTYTSLECNEVDNLLHKHCNLCALVA